MASIQQTAKGYRAQVYVLGVRDSETFPTKREATAWASKRETELRNQTTGKASTTKTLADALRRYADEVSPKRRGWRWELLRLDAFGRSTLPTKLRLSAIRAEHIAQWRDDRLREVEPGTVLRDLGLLSAVFEVCRREWRWIESNPVKDIRKPPEPSHRTRVISWTEIKAMLRQLDHQPRRKPETLTHAIAICFLAALRTGMRAGELTNLDWGRVYPKYARLLTTKTGVPRDVPLSPKAVRVIDRMRGFHHEKVFAVKGPTLDAMFRRARQRAGLEGFTFHDSRHTAATWIGSSGRLTMLEMCRMFGWKDPKHALIYFNPTASDLAGKL